MKPQLYCAVPVHMHCTSCIFMPMHTSDFPTIQVAASDTFPLFVAEHDFQGQTNEDLSLKKGDVLSIINKDWWYAESKETGKKGFVPSNFLVAHDSYTEW